MLRASPSNKTYLQPISQAEEMARRATWASPHNESPRGRILEQAKRSSPLSVRQHVAAVTLS
jgi:hypothetical protein